MFSLDSAKPVIATALVACYLPVPFYLLWMHGLQRVWRRMGFVSYALHVSLYGAMVWAVIRMHALWSGGEWRWPDALSWVAVAQTEVLPWFSIIPLGVSLWLMVESYRTIDFKTLHQIRQLVPKEGRTIVRDGILGHMRHPRYVTFSLIGIGNAALTGYPLVAVSAVLTLFLFAWVIRLEEHEMAAYFGEEFEKYRREVPALWPRSLRRGRDS
jgi:protein-S-isoprenylcysteine O-methyltransferase Ste14